MSENFENNYRPRVILKKTRRSSSANGLLQRHSAIKIKMTEETGQLEHEKRRRKFLHRKSIRAVRLISTTIVYLFFGAFVFSFLEYDADEQLRNEIAQIRNEMQQKYNFTEKDFNELEKIVIHAIPFSAGYQWKFAGALYFCTVVVTTVGYGHSTPATVNGRLFCMGFALIGIPLSLVMFQSVGERVNTFIGFCLLKIRQILASRKIFILPEIKSKHLLFVSLSIGTLTIALGTFVFHKFENWSWFNSLYYIVITFSTIGFGDLVPLQTGGRLQKAPGYVFFTICFILCGLAIFSACINLLILEFMASNADIVTARTRIRRLLSLRRSTSFQQKPKEEPKKVVEPGNANYASRLSRHYRLSRHSELLDGIANDLKTKETIKKAKKKDKKFFANVYRLYIQNRPDYFTVRRLPSTYIDHLVNFSPTDEYL
uniref:Potassium channel domain-containing protein n=1 Tax=Panagrolaimus sp. JU765 TaxID=591449 RepID=A0AC34RRD2_9BILA